MSARSIVRNHSREIARTERRIRRRAALGASLAVVGGAALAGQAQAATFQVNSVLDGPGGACDATCTLRDAATQANADAAADTITFAPSVTGVIRLDESLPIILSAATTIQGPGADVLAVSGDFNTDGTGDTQVFSIDADTVGAAGDPVSISGLTVTKGSSGGNGGNIQSANSDLTLTRMIIRDGLSTSQGGGLYSEGRLTIADSSFIGNSADNGGGLYADQDSVSALNGDITITNSTFTGNEATDYNGGGAYFDQYSDKIVVAGSTFNGNSADDDGGAINMYGARDGGFTLRDSTVSGNTAGAEGGGVKFGNYFDRPMRIENSTIAGNSAANLGGGIYRYAGDDQAGEDDVVVSSSIVADNVAPAGSDLGDRVPGVGDDPVSGTFQVGFSLIENPAGAAITATPNGSNKTGVDPALAPLADNGGPTLTHLPATTSPVVDSGVANGLTIDQRGLPRTVDQPPVPGATGSDGTDIGSVELGYTPPPDTTVDGANAKAKKTQKQGKSVKVKINVGAAEAVDVIAKGKIKAGKKSFKLKSVKASSAAGATRKLVLKLAQKSANSKILDVLDAGKKAKAKVQVVFTDASGNKASKKAAVKLK